MNGDTGGSVKAEPATFYTPPPPVGSYEIGKKVFVLFTKKPNWFHRKMTRILLGWKWVDGDV